MSSQVPPSPRGDERAARGQPDHSDAQRSVDLRAGGSRIAATSVTLAIVQFGVSVIAAQYFGTEGRGLLALVFLSPALLISIANLGLPHAALFHGSANPADAGRWIGTASVLSVVSGVVFATIGFFAVELVIPDDQRVILGAARAAMLVLAVQPLVGVLIHPWLGLGKVGRWNWLRAAVELIPLGYLGIAVLVGTRAFGFVVGAQLCLFVVLTTVALWQWRGEGLGWDASTVRPILAYSLPTALAVVPYALSFRLDQAFLANYRPPEELGQYVVAVAWGRSSAPILNTLANLALPRVVKSAADRDSVVGHVRVTALVAIAVATLMGLASPLIVPLVYGSEFAEAGRLALVLVPATAILGLSTVIEELLRAVGRPRSPLAAQLSGLAITLSTVWWATDRYGAWGAAVVSAATYAAVLVWAARALARWADVPASTLFRVGRREFALVGGLGARVLARRRR